MSTNAGSKKPTMSTSQQQNDKKRDNQINASSGSYVTGDINTDGGDFVGRDKVIINQLLSEEELQDQENRRALGRLVIRSTVRQRRLFLITSA